MNFIINAYALQDIGQRGNQEDCFFPTFLDPCHFDETPREWSFFDGTPHTDDRLFIVCDGMGGHDRGEVASRIVTHSMSQSLMASSSNNDKFDDSMIYDAVDEALDALIAQEDPKEEKKMGTTMTVLKFHSEGATVGHLGDSRVYQFRPAHDNQPAQILFKTVDHSVVNDLVRRGQMSASEAAISPQRHVLSRCMMATRNYHPDVEIDHITDIQPGDIFLLCTDGLYENMDDGELCNLMCDPNFNDVERVQEMLLRSIDNRDNHTAFVVRVENVLNASCGDDEYQDNNPLVPGTTLKSQNYSYHIEKVLGQGAFGITYLASINISMRGQLGTIHTGVKVAIKEFFMHHDMKRKGDGSVISSDNPEVAQFSQKFRREASKLAMLSHPNIVKVLEVFEANETIYYSMEYIPGGSLKEYILEKHSLPEQEAISYIRQIGSALKYLHSNRILHLDVKPGNVMRDVTNNTLKLIDFGLAKRYEENGEAESEATIGSGTPGYSPVEQTDKTCKLKFSPQLDVYALGATYYKMLTGDTPYNAVDILNDGLSVKPLINKKVSRASIAAIEAAMEPSTSKRLRTVRQFLSMLPRIDDQAVFKPKRKITLEILLVIIIVIVFVTAIGLKLLLG